MIKSELLYDSLMLHENYFRAGNKYVISQQLVFLQNDSIVKVIDADSEFSETLSKTNFESQFLPFVFTEGNVFSQSDEQLFVLYGWRLENGSKEICVYYNQLGERIFMTICGKSSCDSISFIRKYSSKFYLMDLSQGASFIIFPPHLCGANL